MTKIQTLITLDMDVKYKLQKLGINISGAANKYFKQFISEYYPEEGDLFEINKRLDEIKDVVSDLKIEESTLFTKKIVYEEKKKHAQQQNLKESVQMADMVKRSGVLDK